MNKTIAFIGTGNIGSAMIRGLLHANILPPQKIIASNRTKEKLQTLHNQTHITMAKDNIEAVRKADYIFLCVEPKMFKTVAREIGDAVTQDKLIISVAASVSMQELHELFSPHRRILRIMPNTPILVGEGLTMVCKNDAVWQEDLENVKTLLRAFSDVEVLDEKYINAFTALAASSPAFIYILIEAMADAAVSMGLSRERSYRIVAKAVLGSAKMVLETGKHPGELKDMVTSPAGTTIEALASLEKTGFRSSIIEALKVGEAKCSQIEK